MDNIDKLKEKINKLKRTSKQLSDDISMLLSPFEQKNIVTSTTIHYGKLEPAINNKTITTDELLIKQDLGHKIAQYEQQIQYLTTKVTNLEHEKNEYQNKFNELQKESENLYQKLKYLEEEKNKLIIDLDRTTKKLSEHEYKSSILYMLNMIERFSIEFNRHLRNTLGLIYETTNMLINSPEISDEMKSKIKIIEQQVKIILNSFSEAQKKYHFTEPKLQKIDIYKFVKDKFIELVKKYKMQGITITQNYPEKSTLCLIDPELFTEAIENIVINSIEAMPKGGLISIDGELCKYCSKRKDITNIPKEGAFDIIGESQDKAAVIQFSDTGVGIAPHLVDKVFNPFLTTNPDNHTGLGLTRTYWIIKLHNGEIEIKSVPNKGTVVKLLIPIVE
jgi:signal transduction histidine kinase